MSIKKLSTILFLAIIMTAGIVFAKSSKDFLQDDFNRALKGDKNLAGALLEGSDFSCRDFSGVDFRGAELEKVNFQNANLTNADFKGADLEEANLKGANITGANFKGAELELATWTNGRVCAEDSVGSCW